MTSPFLAEVEEDFTCGRLSGIPECCTLFYAFVLSRYQPLRRFYMSKIPTGTGYVPCPRCLEGKRFVKVRECILALTENDFVERAQLTGKEYLFYRCTTGCGRLLLLDSRGLEHHKRKLELEHAQA